MISDLHFSASFHSQHAAALRQCVAILHKKHIAHLHRAYKLLQVYPQIYWTPLVLI